jgi:hypothetical protein
MDSRFSTGKYCSKTRRWSVAFFSYIFDTTRVNVQTLVSLNQEKDPRRIDGFAFGKDFVLALVKPWLQKRETSGMKHNLLLKMYLLTQDR